jgi:methionyl-tRNA formyltransferase
MMMKWAFAGTPEFAAHSLAALLEKGYRPAFVLTQPDRPAGRGMKLRASPVKQCALDHQIPVYQPLSLKQNQEIYTLFQEAQVDVFIVVAYGLIIPSSLLSLPRWGCWNVHASLLPRWRGAAPIQRAIQAGDTETGVGIMQMEAGLDTGPVYYQCKTPIFSTDTTGTLQERLAHLGAEALLHVIQQAEEHRLPSPVPQRTEGIVYADKVHPDEARLDWNQSADTIARWVRAFNPHPGAWVMYHEERLKIWEAEAKTETFPSFHHVLLGTFFHLNHSIYVICGQHSVLELKTVQRAGSQRTSAEQWWNQVKQKESTAEG